MTKTVNIHEAKTHLSRLLQQAEEGEEVIIARSGKPVARLVPVEQKPRAKRKPGALKGQIWMAPDFDETPEWLIDMFYEGDPSQPSPLYEGPQDMSPPPPKESDSKEDRGDN